jgi:hypothetical protein
MPALPFSNSRAGTELDGDDHLSVRVRLPQRTDGLLLGGGVSLLVDLRPSLDSDKVGIFQKQVLLLQFSDEPSPASLRRIVSGLWDGGGFSVVDKALVIPITCLTLYIASVRNREGPKRSSRWLCKAPLIS